MKNMTVATAMTIFIAILIVAVGYAAIGNKTLTVTGNAVSSGYDPNFVVGFDTTASITKTNCTASVTNATTAVMTVASGGSGQFTKKGDTATAVFTIKNTSQGDLGATLTADVTKPTNQDYFTVTSSFSNNTVAAGGSVTLTVTVTLAKTPAKNVQNVIGSSAGGQNFVVTVTATPTN